MICKRVHYCGRVQGVGFRYTTQHIARDYAVAGYVRNMPDGSVEIVAEGESEHVEAFLNVITARMSRYIDRTDAQDEAPGQHDGFRIRY